MRVFPDCDGPMARWPRVEAVPGIEAALAGLQPRYRLVLATNAADSGAALVREALARVGLEGHFDGVLTARELGVRKPEPAFFQAVLRQTGCPPREAAVVGDDYQADVAGPKAVGLRAVWFNPGAAPCPVSQPLHDAEVREMAGLPAALAGPLLPDVAECLALLAEQEAPPNLLRHCQAVAALAFRLAEQLRDRGEPVDPLLAHRGGLLHDLDKITSMHLREQHGHLGARLLREKGYPVLASIIERHLMFAIVRPAAEAWSWEEKLVFYADKVVEEDRVVPLQERLAALCQRYPMYAERIRHCGPVVEALEAEICRRLGTSAADLPGLLGGRIAD